MEATRWIKRGLIFSPVGDLPWAKHSALQPTPLLRTDGSIRIFAGFRDDEGVGRVGFVDLSRDDPPRIARVSQAPVLDIGQHGAFDDNGVIPCAIIDRGSELWLYYAGYSLGRRARFLAFSGLAISRDGGESFERFKETPIIERSPEGLLFRVVHSLRLEDGVWRAWYGAGSAFLKQGDGTVPSYDIRYMESPDGVLFPETGSPCIALDGAEYRIGRPFVFKERGKYKMYFGASSREKRYRLTTAISSDGKLWTRAPEELELPVLPGDFDGEMSAFPALVQRGSTKLLFYNGNDYGRAGIGLACAVTP